MAKYKLIQKHIKATYQHPELGLLTFDAATTPEDEYEFYYDNGFSSIFIKYITKEYKNIKHNEKND